MRELKRVDVSMLSLKISLDRIGLYIDMINIKTASQVREGVKI